MKLAKKGTKENFLGSVQKNKYCSKAIARKLGFVKKEKLNRVLIPHFLSMYQLYLIWLYFIGVGIFFILRHDTIMSKLSSWIVLKYSSEVLFLIFWVFLVIAPALVISVFRINWRWIGGFGIIVIIGILMKYRIKLLYIENYTLVFFGILGILGTEIYRRTHRYYITNYRIILKAGLLGIEKRTLLYSQISDLVITKTLVGRIFKFGTIIPVTGSGFGLGEDMSAVGVGIGAKVPLGPLVGVGIGGGKSVKTPRGRNPYILFGVPRPEEQYNLITKLMIESSERYKEAISDVKQLVQEIVGQMRKSQGR